MFQTLAHENAVAEKTYSQLIMDALEVRNGAPQARVTLDEDAEELVIRVPVSAAAHEDLLEYFPSSTSITVHPINHRRDEASGSMTLAFSASWRPFPFLSLPPETRNDVYKRLFRVSDKKHPVEVRKERKTGKLDSIKYMMPWTVWDAGFAPQKMSSIKNLAGLLGVNRKLHQECLAYLYGDNYFYFSQSSGLETLLDRGMCILQFIRHVHVGNLTSSGKLSRGAILNYLKDAPSLESFNMTDVGNLGGKSTTDWIDEDITKIYPVIDRLKKNLGVGLDKAVAAFHIPSHCRCQNCPDGTECLKNERYLKTKCEWHEKQAELQRRGRKPTKKVGRKAVKVSNR